MTDTNSTLQIKRALISVSDKAGVADLAKTLAERGAEILSTGGTARALRDAGVAVTDVSDVTGFPEIMEGRVKTLHPLIHGGILAKRASADHRAAMEAHGIAGIDMVVVNLYPFEETVASGAEFATCVENIDIGGPAMIRAAAKNHNDVAVVTSPDDYARVLEEVAAGGVTAATRRALAAGAFARTAAYDSAITAWLSKQDEGAPRRATVSATLSAELRYGENPHQAAALYHTDGDTRPGPARAEQLQGKKLSYNNLLDADAAFSLIADIDDPAVAIIKHANPCGVAVSPGGDMLSAYQRALACDPVSAFGGIIALNRPLDAAAASAIADLFVEVVIAPAVDDAALEIMAKKKSARVLATGSMPSREAAAVPAIRQIAGGLLVQGHDTGHVGPDGLKVVSDREPTDEELADLLFAFRVAKHVKSNAIVYAKGLATVGVGAGQMSRVDSARIAAAKAKDSAEAAGEGDPATKGSVVASDAFFPFADGLIQAAEAGVTAVIQPGGSVRDAEVIDAANARGLSMVFTGMRHFRH